MEKSNYIKYCKLYDLIIKYATLAEIINFKNHYLSSFHKINMDLYQFNRKV
jgi:hypothetical protein